ncbi:PREDICTED: uncharacterized protein LOC109589414 [Amphimedon queenslandica]|uniref:Uncharacterized protein n=1 Tax=Amphimedon queenslandica TaxID=400682 RepID=A0A1X7VNI5_AMPQE|nr:PREDICTED: uncharacterized protein LOC109589414 [Amphimedon queenslandica]|eukprot:XP_019861069.1 PREDICTED: uncharacterized protein LOC109589414 [Amphimedon queenslandica]
MSDACSFPQEKYPTAESDATIESGLYVSVELKDTKTDLFLSKQRLMNEAELSVVKESAVVTKTLHHSHVWAPLAAAVCNKASLLTNNKKLVYVGWDGLGHMQKESDRGKLGRIHVQQREELNELKDMHVVQKTLKEDQQELVHHAKQLFSLRDPAPPPLSPASSTAASSSNVLITSSASSCYQSQKSVKTKLFVSTVFKVAARRRKNVLDRLTTEQIKNISASSKTRRFSHDSSNDRDTPEKSSSWEAGHLGNSEETEHDMTLSLPSELLGIATTSSKPEVETITEEACGSSFKTSFISVHNDSTVSATSEAITSDAVADALEPAPLLFASPPPPITDSYRLKSHSSPPLLLSTTTSRSSRVMAKRIVQADGVQRERMTETKEESGERTSKRRPLRETEGNDEKEQEKEEEEEEEVKSKETTNVHDNNKREELDLSQSQSSLIHSMMAIEDDLSPSSSEPDLHTKKFVRVSSETTAFHSNTNFFRQSIASPDFSDSPIHTYFSHPLSASDHSMGHTHSHTQIHDPNLESVPETSENDEKPSGATAKTSPSLPLDDPQFYEYCQQLDHAPTPEDYAAYKILMVGRLIDEKYHDKLNEAISLIMVQAMKNKLMYSEFKRVSRWLSLQAKYVQDQSLLVTWLGYRLYEKLPNLEKVINEYTTQAIEDVTQFGIDWIGDTPFDNPEIRMDYDYDGDIEAEQFKIHDRKNDFPLRRAVSAEVLIDEEQPGEEGQESKRWELWFPGQRSETPPISRREHMSPNVVEVASPNEAKKMLQDNRNNPSLSRPMVLSISSQSSVSDSVSSSVRTIGSATGNGRRNSLLANIRESDCEERGEGGGAVFYYSSPSPPLQSKSGGSEAGHDSTNGERNDEDSEGGKEEEGEGEGRSRKISGQVMASGLALVAAAAALALRK